MEEFSALLAVMADVHLLWLLSTVLAAVAVIALVVMTIMAYAVRSRNRDDRNTFFIGLIISAGSMIGYAAVAALLAYLVGLTGGVWLLPAFFAALSWLFLFVGLVSLAVAVAAFKGLLRSPRISLAAV